MKPSMGIEDEARWLRETIGWRRDPGMGVIEVTGDEARDWLNGQLTQDLREPAPGSASYALRVDVRGKIQSEIWVLDRDESFLLLLPLARVDSTAASLDGFIIMEDVEVEAQADRVVFTLEGPLADDALEGLGEAWPVHRLSVDGRALIVAADEAEATAASLRTRASDAGGGEIADGGWELARLRAAVPSMPNDFGDFTLPQEAGLTGRAVSFDKGCYVGQEPIVMLEHRGRPPKRLVHLEIEGAATPDDAITTPQGAKVGRLTSVVADPESPPLHWGLGYVKRAFASPDAAFRVGELNARSREVVGESSPLDGERRRPPLD